MKRIITLFLSLLLLACLPLSVFATENDTVLTVGSSNAAYVVDDADLLSASEASELSSIAEEISRRQQCDVVILTVDSLGGKSATAYADDYFDYNGYGYGADRSGILFLLSMEERDWWMSTRGSAIQAFTDDGIQYLFSKCKSNISNGSYAAGFRNYLNTADTMLSAYNGTLSDAELREFQQDFDRYLGISDDGQGSDYSGITRTKSKPSVVKTTVVALIIGFLIAFIISSSLRAQLKTVHMKYNATNYKRPNSMHLDRNRDVYLYANTTSRVIETQRSSGGSHGGSSTHVSSSGATHGGGGGKF